MGCDIHIYTEIKKDNAWQTIKTHNGYKDDLRSYLEKAKNNSDEKNVKYYIERLEEEEDFVYEGIYDGRNYDLFGILADVRNGRGFAGCDTGNGFIPISQPKGLPIDVSEKVQEESDNWDCDGHSHTYFSLQELLDYDWNRTTEKRGWVSKQEYKTFLKNGAPDGWSGGIDGGCVVHISNEEMENRISNDIQDETKCYYTLIEWCTLYSESASCFYTDTIPKLKAIAEANNISYDDVRIIFWFDN